MSFPSREILSTQQSNKWINISNSGGKKRDNRPLSQTLRGLHIIFLWFYLYLYTHALFLSLSFHTHGERETERWFPWPLRVHHASRITFWQASPSCLSNIPERKDKKGGEKTQLKTPSEREIHSFLSIFPPISPLKKKESFQILEVSALSSREGKQNKTPKSVLAHGFEPVHYGSKNRIE